MDTSKPAVQVFYGKYLDAITNEIPVSDSPPALNQEFTITLEPGKPNFPTVDSTTITLRNLDVQGNELYPKSWFIENSRSEAEGATLPFELFFRVYVFGEVAFTGVYSRKSYSINKDVVKIEIDSVIKILDSDATFLKEFSYKTAYISSSSQGEHPMGSGVTLDGVALTQQCLAVRFDKTGWQPSRSAAASAFNEIEIVKFLGLEFDDFNFGFEGWNVTNNSDHDETKDSEPFSAFVKMEDSTILTRVVLAAKYRVADIDSSFAVQEGVQIYLYLRVWHGHNSNYSDSNETVLQRGRFFRDDEGNSLNSGENVDITIWLPDHENNGREVVIRESDIIVPDESSGNPEWIHGVRYRFTSGDDYEILESEEGKDHFDILSITVAAINSFFSKYYYDPGLADYFDTSKASEEGRKAFLADVLMFNWVGEKSKIKDVITGLARQTNSFLFVNAQGKIVFQDRALFDSDLNANSLPDTSISLNSSYGIDGGESEDFGFETYEINVPFDLVEINNVKSEDERAFFVNKDGVTKAPGLRNSSLEISNFRIYDLAVPTNGYEDFFGIWRRSPESDSFPNYTEGLMAEFIKTPESLAQAYANQLSWPTEFIYLKLPGQNFSSVTAGAVIDRVVDGVQEVFLVTKITRTSSLLKRVELKKLAEWEVVA